MLAVAETNILGLEFGSEYDVVYNAMVDRFGDGNVFKTDGEHIMIKNIEYAVDDVNVQSISCTFSYIDGKHYLFSIALNTEALVMSYESDQEKLKNFNSYAVGQCNALAQSFNSKYKVTNVSKKINPEKKWTLLYKFDVDENVSGMIMAFFAVTKKLMMESGSTFARVVYVDSRYKKESLAEL